jgi:hypothetical protein
MTNAAKEAIGAIVLVLALLLISQIDRTPRSSGVDRQPCYVVGADTSGC